MSNELQSDVRSGGASW